MKIRSSNKNVLTDEEAKKQKKLLTEEEAKMQKNLLTDEEVKKDKKLAKGVDTKDMSILKNLKEDKEKELKKKQEENKKKPPKGVGLASKAKKLAALKILRDAGLIKTAENLATLNSQVVEHLKGAETALQALHHSIDSANVDDMKSVDWQHEIEDLLQIIQKWKSEFPGRVKDLMKGSQPVEGAY